MPDPKAYFAQIFERLTKPNAEGWALAKCCFHEDRAPSLGVNVIHGWFHCHACGEHGGDLLAFHMKRTGKGFVDAVRDLIGGGA